MEQTAKEYGRKPYVEPGKGQDGGHVNAMRRSTQKSEFDEPPAAGMKNNRRLGSVGQNDERKIVSTPLGMISEYVLPCPSWGMTFDNSGGLYATQVCADTGGTGDVLYRPAGSATFAPLGMTLRAWDCSMACAPNGDIWGCVYGQGVYRRAGGAGDFALFEAGTFSGIEADPNGDIYALKAAGTLWVLHPGEASFSQVAGITTRSYYALACSPSGDLYATTYAEDRVCVRTGRAGDFVELQTINEARSICAAPNGDIYMAPYTGSDFGIYKRAGGAGAFELLFTGSRYIMDMSVSSAGYLFCVTGLSGDYQVMQLNLDVGIQDPVNTIVQDRSTPATRFQPLRKNAKPYENKSYAEMQQFAQPIKYSGTERPPETAEAKPILVDHIPPVTWYVRNGAPVVIDIPITDKDPISRIEVVGGDGTASVAPNGISAIYKPGASSSTLLIVHTKSGQQCTVNLIAK